VIKWVETPGGHSHRAKIGGFEARVWWGYGEGREKPGGYAASFGTFRAVKLYTSIEEAKAAAIKIARRRLTEALAALPPEVPR
jgi:hypothetical protein